MNKENIWKITPKTNMHVGSENSTTYGLIDLTIQRDAVTELPCVHSSSLKGAIKEFVASRGEAKSEDLLKIFGSDKTDKDNTQKGGYTFFDACLLALPVPSDNKPYELVTCQDFINEFINKVNALGCDLKESDLGLPLDVKKVSCEDFKEYCNDDNLPIIARNKIEEDGTSGNLWYEQVLPAESVLYTVIESGNDSANLLSRQIDDKIIQLGANGSIGYGFCKFEHL